MPRDGEGERKETRRDLPMQHLRAAVAAGSYDAEKRTIELVWTTGAAVMRRDWWTGDLYEEVLSLDPAHVDLSRLNAGAPLLNTHDGFDLNGMLGVVDRAWLANGEGRAVVRFSDREDVQPFVRDVATGIIRNVSVGYLVNTYEKTESSGKLPVWRAIDWQPTEISLVPVPADPGAGTRAQDRQDVRVYPCTFIDPGARAATEEPAMAQTNAAAADTAEDVTKTDPAEGTRQAPATSPANDDKAAQRIRADERRRQLEVRQAVRKMGLDEAYADKLVEDGADGDVVYRNICDEIARRAAAQGGPRHGATTIEPGRQDETETRRNLMHEALLHRTRPDLHKLSDGARQYRGMRLLDMARDCIEVAGGRTRGLSGMEIAAEALNMTRAAGMMTTSDFPNILANTASRTLRDAYAAAPQIWKVFSRQVTAPDFKPMARIQLGDGPALLKVNENGEFKYGAVGEAAEIYKIDTYGRIVAVTRQVIVNDDLGAMTRLPELLGRKAADLESNLVLGILTANPLMADGNALFSAAHGNLASPGTPITVTAVGAARSAMTQQKGLDGVTFASATPKYLLTGSALQTVAEQFVSTNLLAALTSNINVFANKLIPLMDPRLDAISPTAWFLIADPASIDTIEYAYLEGNEGVYFETRVGFEVDGVELKARHDFGAKAIDWRGMYENPGA